uniref:nuclease-related domain-containing protein n=1 Tax=Thaumasiovibrio occultus TaxID=1891184 RepID=UPI000B35C69B|nr:nuclease-related domain-containing protein [Thaumasiovibrio occultus]
MSNLPYILTVVTLCIVLAHLFDRQFKKMYGRTRQLARRHKLLRILGQAQGHVFCDVVLPTNEHSEPIDFVLICRRGIYLINIHYWRGQIFGLPLAAELVLNNKGKNAKFHNPFYHWHEIRRHILSHLPATDVDIVHPMSCFINAQVMDELPYCMTGTKEMHRYFRRQPEVLSDADIQTLTTRFKQHIAA